MKRNKKINIGKFFIFLLLLLIMPMNTAQAFLGVFFVVPDKEPEALAKADKIDIGSAFEINQADSDPVPEIPVTGVDGQSEEIISDDPGGEFVNPLDTEGDEIVSETCEIDRTPGGKNIMRCSHSKRFAYLDGGWKNFDEVMDENFKDGQMNFAFLGKHFSLVPFIVKNNTKTNITSLNSRDYEALDYRTDFTTEKRYTKWTNTFEGDGAINKTGYTIDTNLPVRYIEEKDGDKLTHLSAVIDNYIEIGFIDLIVSGYSLEREGNNIYVTGLPNGHVELDPEISFYSTSAVDGYISVCYGDTTEWNIVADGTTSSIGETKLIACQGGSGYEGRSYLSFDTSGLDDSITISSATINIYADSYSKSRSESSTYEVNYYIGTNQIGDTLTSGDFGFGSNNGNIDWAGSAGWKAKTITTPDTYVSKTGDTDFELRKNWTPASGAYKWATMRQTEYAGVTSDPYLEVVWGDYWGNEFLYEASSAIGVMNNSGYKTGISFTAQTGSTVGTVYVNVYAATGSPTYRWGLQSDSSGSPSGTWLTGTSTSSYVDSTAGAGWKTITFASTGRPKLVAGTVYHIVVEYKSGTIGASNYASIRRGDPRNQTLPYRGDVDTSGNTSWYSGSWSAQNYQPIYMIDFYSAFNTDEGNSYYGATAASIYLNSTTYYTRGEKFQVYGNSKSVDTAALYIKKSGSCTPSADLLYKIKDNSDTTLDSGTFLAAGSASASWSWVETSLGSTLDLDAGATYKIYIYSDTTVSCYYQISNYYSSTTTSGKAMNYNGISSNYGFCSNTIANCDADANWTYYDYYDTPFKFNVVSMFTARSQNWRMYGDEDDATPGDAYAAENSEPTDNIGKKEPIKLRLTIADVGGLAEDNIKFGLRYSVSPTFSDGGTAVSDILLCSLSTWCYYNGDNVADDDSISSRVLTDSSTSGRHNETYSAASTFDFTANDEVEFEFTIWGNNPAANTTYYFAAYESIGDQVVAVNPSGDYKYPSLTTSSSFALSVGAPTSKACADYTLGGTGSNTCQLTESGGEEIQMWDDRGTGVGWSVVGVLEHLKAITNGTPYSNESAIAMPKIQNQKVARTSDNILFMAYNDGSRVQFQKSSDGGATWTEAITGSPTTVGGATSDVGLFMDVNENIHICYEEDDDIDYRLLSKTGSQWEIGSASEVVAGSAFDRVYFDCSIAVESDSDVNVAVSGEIALSSTPVIDVYRDTGGGFSSSYGEQTSVDSPTVTVWDGDNVMYMWVTTTFAYSYYNGSEWSAPASIDGSATPNNNYSIITDADDVLHVVYKDSGIHYLYNDGSWSGETTLTSDSNDNYPAISSDGTSLYVFFHDDISGDDWLSYLEYDGSAWDSTPVQLDDVDNDPKPYTPPRVSRNQFWAVYEYYDGSTYDAESWYTHDMIRAGDVNWSTGTITNLYGAEIGSCPSAGVCAGTPGSMDPESNITVADADACTSGCPNDPSFGMGKYYIEPTMVLNKLNLRRIEDYAGTLELTIS